MINIKNLNSIMLLFFLIMGLATLHMANAESPPEGSLANNETYAVTGVDGDDVLNVRAQPEASAAEVGAVREPPIEYAEHSVKAIPPFSHYPNSSLAKAC